MLVSSGNTAAKLCGSATKTFLFGRRFLHRSQAKRKTARGVHPVRLIPYRGS
jgi:hypothetical protein